MTREDFVVLREGKVKREGTLLLVKGREYETDEDFLGSFKADGQALGIDPIKALLVHAGKHWRAIVRYGATGQEGVEGIEGRCDDLVNYLHLLLALVEERHNGVGA